MQQSYRWKMRHKKPDAQQTQRPLRGYAVCRACGLWHSVPRRASIPTQGYFCPQCQQEATDSMRYHAGKAVFWLAIIGITVALFMGARRLAFLERGYTAYGGEYAVLLLPVLIKPISMAIYGSKSK